MIILYEENALHHIREQELSGNREKQYEKGNYKSGCLYCYIFNIGICDQHCDESWKQ